jgi:hypothetical protein
MVIASQYFNFGRWAVMDSGNDNRRNTDERKNYIAANLSIDESNFERFKAAFKNAWFNIKRGVVWTFYIVMALGVGGNFYGYKLVKQENTAQNEAVVQIQTKYDALQTKVAMCEETQKRQIELIPLIEQLTNLLKNNRPMFRNPQARREFDEVTTKILKIKPISQGEDLRANPGLPSPENYTPFRGVKNE